MPEAPAAGTSGPARCRERPPPVRAGSPRRSPDIPGSAAPVGPRPGGFDGSNRGSALVPGTSALIHAPRKSGYFASSKASAAVLAAHRAAVRMILMIALSWRTLILPWCRLTRSLMRSSSTKARRPPPPRVLAQRAACTRRHRYRRRRHRRHRRAFSQTARKAGARFVSHAGIDVGMQAQRNAPGVTVRVLLADLMSHRSIHPVSRLLADGTRPSSTYCRPSTPCEDQIRTFALAFSITVSSATPLSVVST